LITLTRLNGSQFVINAEMIETIEATPDTVISLMTKAKYLVRESVDDVINGVVTYKRKLYATSFDDDQTSNTR